MRPENRDTPKLMKIRHGWAALGDGWAVHGATKAEATRRFAEARRRHAELRKMRPIFESKSK